MDQEASPSSDVGPDRPDIRTVRPRPARVIRLSDPAQQKLRAAVLDLWAQYRVETEETVLLGQFFDEAFETWLQAKLAAAGKKGKKGASSK